MSSGGNEVEACVDPGVVVVEERTFDLQFLLQVGLKLGIDILHDRLIARMQKKVFYFLFLFLFFFIFYFLFFLEEGFLKHIFKSACCQSQTSLYNPPGKSSVVPSSLRAKAHVPYLGSPGL